MSGYKNENKIKDYEIISEIIEDYLKYSDKGLDFQKITDGILQISEAKFAVFNRYEEEGQQFTSKAISGENKIIQKALNLLGIEILGKKWDHDEVRDAKIKKDIITRFANISQLIGDILPKKLTNELAKSFDIGEVLVAKITKDNIMLGDFTLIMSKEKNFENPELVEKYCRHIGLLIEKIRLEEKLKKINKDYNQNSKMLKTITDNMIDQVALTDAMGNFNYIGKSYSILGYEIDSLIGKNIMELVHSEDLPIFKKRLRELIKNRLPLLKEEYRIRCKDGSYLWWETTGNLLIENNHIKGIVFSSRDITEAKKLREHLELSEERFRKLFNEVSSVAIQGYQPDGTVVFWNKASQHLYGYSQEEALSQNLIDLVIPDKFKNTVKNNIKKMFQIGKPLTPAEEITMQHKDGTLIPVYSNHVIVKMDSGTSQLFCLDIDMRNQKSVERQLYIEKELFKTTLLSVGDGVISTNSEGNVVMMNKISEKLTGWKKEEAYGKPLEKIFNIKNNDKDENIKNPVNKILNSGEKIEINSKNILISRDGNEKPIEGTASSIVDNNDNITGTVFVFRDFTKKKKQQDRIRKLSFEDHLTGLYNRRYYETELKRLDVERNLPLSTMVIDVNGLKLINDAFGHSKGDDILIKSAQAIKNNLREDEIAARVGGDEFSIILPKCENKHASKIAERIKENIDNYTEESVPFSLSIGFYTKEKSDEEISEVLKKAESKMYTNKIFSEKSKKRELILTMLSTLHEKHPREEEHSKRVSKLCYDLGKAIKIKGDRLNMLKTAGLLHDIGKIGIDYSIIEKPGRLTQEEYGEIKKHPEIGYRILKTSIEYEDIAKIVLHHHEKIDGSGYPKGIRGSEIPLESKIISIVDAFDAMISSRPYKKNIVVKEAVDELKKCSGTQFDSDLVEVFTSKVLR